MPGQNVKDRLQDAFFELLYQHSLHGTLCEEGLLRDCERILSNLAPPNPRLESYLKQIVEQISAVRNLKTRIDWVLDEIEEAGGRSLNKDEMLLLDQETEIENWLVEQADHFDERFGALWNCATAPPTSAYRPDDADRHTSLS
jgi:hypothetical protein